MAGKILFILYTALILSDFIEASSTKRFRRQLPFNFDNLLRISPESDPFSSSVRNFGLVVPPPINSDEPGALKAYGCSLMRCGRENQTGPACACNFNTGNVVSFKNECDVLKHNCRFDTEFRVILNEICPWEFQSRRNNKQITFDYTNSKYYN